MLYLVKLQHLAFACLELASDTHAFWLESVTFTFLTDEMYG